MKLFYRSLSFFNNHKSKSKCIKKFIKNILIIQDLYQDNCGVQITMQKKDKYYIQEKPQTALGWWQSLSSTITNLRYDANKAFIEIKQKVFEPEEDTLEKQIFIQGKKYTTRKEAKQIVRKILWFSYRKNIQIKNDKKDYKSDVGWGCLARVGQMALASALNKYFQSESSRLNFQNSQSDIENLILAFSDVEGTKQKYSLNKILQTADQLFQLKVGQWFNISSISTCLQKLQNKRPMRGSQGLKIMFFDQSINIRAIYELQNLNVCICVKKVLVCEKCHSNYQRQTKSVLIKNPEGRIQTFIFDSKHNKEEVSTENAYKSNEKSVHHPKGITMLNNHCHTKHPRSRLEIFRNRVFDKDLCMFVLTRVGNPTNFQSINKAIFRLLDLSFCLGIMTGFPRQAIFVVGREGNRLIYLNPHYVQQHDTRDMLRKDSYFCQQYLTCERTDLDPSMGFCFYLQTVAQLQQLNSAINYILQNYKDALSIGTHYSSWSDYEEKDYIEEEQNEQESFSNLSWQSCNFRP